MYNRDRPMKNLIIYFIFPRNPSDELFPKITQKIISLCFLLKSKVHTDTARLPSLLLPFRVMMSIVSPWINCTMYLFDHFITKVNFKGIWKGYAFKVDLCYKKALDECRYRYTLHYEPPTTNKRKKIDNGTTYSGTTPHSAKTSAPISDTPKDHKLKKSLIVTQSRSVTAAWITPNRSSTTTTNAF